VIRHLLNFLLWGLPPTRLFALRRALLRVMNVEIAPDACVCGRGWIYGRGRLAIGAGTWLSPGVIVHTHPAAPIIVGARCDVGPGVEFVPGGHEIGSPSRRAGRGTAAAITVEAGCWIGARSLLLGGVTIGAGSIVAAGSVVTKHCDRDSLIAGVPATPRRTLVP
jgi:maltose O-acetyltransferase